MLFSQPIQKCYTGYTADFAKRLLHHNSGQYRFSKKGRPWELVRLFLCEDKKAVMLLEKRVKARGAKRF
ncbi:MAG: GIY-YIG nuclease family protein [Saprospiraceae bacterium]|nr:GIY-YIG nuclease family protein [Saprospiraceae bacterium]